jgi:hypothetical protein
MFFWLSYQLAYQIGNDRGVSTVGTKSRNKEEIATRFLLFKR